MVNINDFDSLSDISPGNHSRYSVTSIDASLLHRNARGWMSGHYLPELRAALDSNQITRASIAGANAAESAELASIGSHSNDAIDSISSSSIEAKTDLIEPSSFPYTHQNWLHRYHP